MAVRLGLVVLAFLIGTGLVAHGGPTPSPEELRARIAEAYAGLKSYEAAGELTFEVPGLFTARIPFRIWASYPRLRVEYEPVEPASGDGLSLLFATVIADVAAGRQLAETRAGSWVEEELELGWWDFLRFGLSDQLEAQDLTVLGEEVVAGRPMWVLEGTVRGEAIASSYRVWVDKESFLVRRVRVESAGMTMVYEIHDFRPGVEVPEHVFRLPPGAKVTVRPPRSPEAEAIMAKVWDKHKGLTSFFLSKTERWDGSETGIMVWYKDPIFREERTSLIPIPGMGVTTIGPVSVRIQDFATGANYFMFRGEWEGVAGVPVAPVLRSQVALAMALGLADGVRYTAVEEDTLGGRPVWRVTGELGPVLDDAMPPRRWWVDRETYAVLQYEEPLTVVFNGVRRTETRTSRIDEFRPGAEVPKEKLVLPEGVVLKKPEELRAAAAIATEPGERAEKGVSWEPFSAERLAAAQAEGKPVILYFRADWCLPCLDYEDGAWHDKRVVEAAEAFVRLKVDLSDWGSPQSARLSRQYKVSSLPLTVILDPQGKEVRRVVGAVPAWVLLEALRAAGASR